MTSSAANPAAGSYGCPICGDRLSADFLLATDDSACPCCGQALWFVRGPACEGGTSVMLLTEFIDGGDTRKQVNAILAATRHPSRLILDLSRLRFLPNSILRLLLALQGRLGSTGGALAISGLRLRNYNTLRKAHLTKVLCIGDEPEELSATQR